MAKFSGWKFVVLGTSALLGAIACLESDLEPVSETREAAEQSVTVTIRLPATLSPSSVVLAADGALRLADRVLIPASSSGPTAIANAGTTETNVGADARVRDVWSRASVVLRDRAQADGSVRSEGTVTRRSGATVTGAIVEQAVLTPVSLTSWNVTLPATNSGDVTLAPGARRNLAPGSYRNLTVSANAVLTLNPGTYFFQAMSIEPQAVVSLNTTNGPILAYVRAGLTFRGAVSDPQGRADFMVVGIGTSPIVLDSAFVGTIVAPQAALTMAPATHTGAFFAKDADVRPDARLVSKPFRSIRPGPCTGVPDNAACTDANACTSNDKCKKGQCQGTPVTCPATGNACVGAFCDAASGSCLKTALDGKPCNDGNPSTTGEICLSGSCAVAANTTTGTCGAEVNRVAEFQSNPNAWQPARAVEEGGQSYLALAGSDEESLAFTDFVTIPIVFHILEHPSIRPVTDQEVLDMVTKLNAIYRTLDINAVHPDHQAHASATHIQFELARRGPTCATATNGINRVPTTVEEFVANSLPMTGPTNAWADPAQGGVAAWDSRKYLNVWIASYRPGNVPAGFTFGEAARAFFPTRHGLPDDGVILGLSPFANGTVFSGGLDTVLAHEVGHYFNLFHIDTPNEGRQPSAMVCAGATAATCATAGDLVCDTPAMHQRSLPCLGDTNTCVDSPEDQVDQSEGLMDSGPSNCSTLLTFGQVDRMEATLATTRNSLLGSDGNLPPEPAADHWIRDGEGDLGQQPNDLQVLWATDDVWVRQQADGRTVQQHQNPIFRPSQPNSVYVRVRNRGCAQAENQNVTLYWAKASSSLAWPTPWNGTENLPNGAPLGNAVATQSTGIIPAGGSVILEFSWDVPDPQLYASVGGDISHFCLLAQVGAAPGPQDLYQLVQSSNDTAWKNVTVTTETGALETAAVGVDGRHAGTQRLVFNEVPNPASPASLFTWGRVVVDLGPGLFARWDAGGRVGSGFDIESVEGTSLTLLNSGATLANLSLQPADHFTLSVTLDPLVSTEFVPRSGLDVYELEVTQLSEATTPFRTVGGQRFVIKTDVPPPTVNP